MIYSDEFFYIKRHESELPWVKLFTHEAYKELSDMPKPLYTRLFELVREIELAMREFYKADKINVASFANQLPRVHIHIIARFKDDEYFPNNPWEQKLRKNSLNLPDFSEFASFLQARLKSEK